MYLEIYIRVDDDFLNCIFWLVGWLEGWLDNLLVDGCVGELAG